MLEDHLDKHQAHISTNIHDNVIKNKFRIPGVIAIIPQKVRFTFQLNWTRQFSCFCSTKKLPSFHTIMHSACKSLRKNLLHSDKNTINCEYTVMYIIILISIKKHCDD